ncbi:MAG: ribosomal protein S18-alanine N-acetyltransferase [Methylophilaceae bacterium]|nr:ribosomal protein S18-alanine N-acetyltransferase [Methylophilaceae bacterium]
MNAVLKPEVRLRPMQVADLDTVMRIEPVIYPFPWSLGNFRDSLNTGYSCWVFELDGRIAGYTVMMLVLDEAHLLNLSVAKEAQGQGYGDMLLSFIMDKAREHGALNMFLEVRVSNKVAISLYEKKGFNEMAIRPRYYPAENGREDAMLMGAAL